MGPEPEKLEINSEQRPTIRQGEYRKACELIRAWDLWSVEDPLPDGWPVDEKGDPLSCDRILKIVLGADKRRDDDDT
jgi:hypothetical protein